MCILKQFVKNEKKTKVFFKNKKHPLNKKRFLGTLPSMQQSRMKSYRTGHLSSKK